MPNNNAGGWPDPTRPGVPMNPERDGWHWLRAPFDLHAVYWRSKDGVFHTAHMKHLSPSQAAMGWDYAGPCLTPAEVTAREEAAAMAMRASVATEVSRWSIAASEAVEALPLPTAALDALLAQAREEGAKAEREACLHIVDSTATTDGRASQQIMKRIRARGDA